MADKISDAVYATASKPSMIAASDATGLGTAVQLDNKRPVALLVPIMTATSMTFQGSADGVTYSNLYDDTGTEISVTVSTSAARMVALDPAKFAGCVWIKPRAGTSGSPTTEASSRTISVIAQVL